MEGYLQGFTDGYNKALEQLNKGALTVSIQMDNKEIANVVYKHVTELQERDARIKGNYNAR